MNFLKLTLFKYFNLAFKHKLIVFTTLFILSGVSNIVFAGNLDTNPTIDGLLDLVGRAIVMLAGGAALVFVAMIAYGAWKASMALGDPRGLDAAKKTWTYAMFGVLVAVGALSVFAIVARILGVSYSLSLSPLTSGIRSALGDLFGEIISNVPAEPGPSTPAPSSWLPSYGPEPTYGPPAPTLEPTYGPPAPSTWLPSYGPTPSPTPSPTFGH